MSRYPKTTLSPGGIYQLNGHRFQLTSLQGEHAIFLPLDEGDHAQEFPMSVEFAERACSPACTDGQVIS